MSHHEKTDKQVVISQLICFLFASVIGFMADLFIKEGRDAIFITGTILVAIKLAREGWDMTAAGYTLLSIACGVFFWLRTFRNKQLGLIFWQLHFIFYCHQ